MVHSGEEEGQLRHVVPVYLIDHATERGDGVHEQHILKPLPRDIFQLVQHQVQLVGGLQPLAAALAQPLQQTDVLAVGVVAVKGVVPDPFGNGERDGGELTEVALRDHFVYP